MRPHINNRFDGKRCFALSVAIRDRYARIDWKRGMPTHPRAARSAASARRTATTSMWPRVILYAIAAIGGGLLSGVVFGLVLCATLDYLFSPRKGD